MALSERHRWCMNKMLEAFSPELTTEAAQAFIRNEANLQKFNTFFKGDSSGRLFVFFQPEAQEGEVSAPLHWYNFQSFLFFLLAMVRKSRPQSPLNF